MNRAFWALLLSALVAFAPLPAQERLGQIEFPNSGSSAAQPEFFRGALLLHSFEYERAAVAFRAAEQLDSSFALAFWGEAMTYTHPVWNQQDREAARAALARLGPTPAARAAKAMTLRERGYLEAVETLYGEGSKARRDTAYAGKMERLAAQYPQDLEAKSFYALALLGLNQGTRDVPTYLRAGLLAEEVFRQNLQHPGAAHYVIHAYDDPEHAARGLEAARAYSKIAPDAPHAQHMTTHIFLALGMWDEVVTQNEIASGHDHAKWRPGHYTGWLHYGYVQQGRYRDAEQLLEALRSHMLIPSSGRERSELIAMRAHHVFDTEGWSHPILDWPIPTSDLSVYDRAVDAFVAGFAAEQRRDLAVAERALASLYSLAAADGNVTDPTAAILARELRASIRLAAGDSQAALALLAEATRLEDAMPIDFGPPVVVKPSHEFFGEVLLAVHRPVEAQAEFTRALRLTPRRVRALIGLANAARAAGDVGTASHAFDELRGIWHLADPALSAKLAAVP